MTLRSTNAFDYPIINPGLLSDEGGFDMHTMREALKAGRRFLQAPAWDSWIVGEYGDSANAQTDEEIEDFIRANALVVNHVSGTVAMGKRGTTGQGSGALNPDLTVKGTIGLRVVDASAFVRAIPRNFRAPETCGLTGHASTAFHSCCPYHDPDVRSRRAGSRSYQGRSVLMPRPMCPMLRSLLQNDHLSRKQQHPCVPSNGIYHSGSR